MSELETLMRKYNGFWEVKPKVPVQDSYSLSLVYTPGVGRVSSVVAENPEKSFELTNRGNSLAVIGLKNLSKVVSLEKKAILFREYAGIDAYPLVLDTDNPEIIGDLLLKLAPTFGGFIFEDVSEDIEVSVEKQIAEKLKLPVFYNFKLKNIESALNDASVKSHLKAEEVIACIIRSFFDSKGTILSSDVILKVTEIIKSGGKKVDILKRIIFETACCFVDEADAEQIKSKYLKYLNEGKKSWFKDIPKFEELEKFSLVDKSVELHSRTAGAIEVASKINVKNYDYPVEELEEKLQKYPELVNQLSLKGNLAAVISDGSAVLGLGNIGPEAALPVMEGKAVLFKSLGAVDAIPVCLDTQDVGELIESISMIAPVLGGINLEDISAPRCFEIEKALKEKLNIPIFHDDQHGTAVVVLAGIINALKLAGKRPESVKLVVNGAGAGAIAVSKLLLKYGVKNLILCDTKGAIYKGRQEGMNPFKEEIAGLTNPEKEQGKLVDVIKNADVFIGLSVANIVNKDMVSSMKNNPIIFALSNPVPEIMPDEAREAGAYIVATGRSDLKNQVNNSLAFPGIFRGTLDVMASDITDEMKISAAYAIAELVSDKDLNPDYIIPHALDLNVPPAVAKAVAQTAINSGVAQNPVNPDEIAEKLRTYYLEGVMRK